ncbi:MAG: histidinol-phosphatase [Spirochaetales bacterium]|nr:histidinol-phosphatase [Spirochaetales bacterium]
MIRTNYHTHTEFCDAKHSAEEMVLAAIEKNISILGFSSHAMYPFNAGWHIKSDGYSAYVTEINRLKEKYADKIKIYTGFEVEYIDGISVPTFDAYSEFKPDYLIGSVHFVPGNGGYYEADGGENSVRERIGKFFGGSVKKAVQEYFSCERKLLKDGDFTFLGHCDLVQKQNIKSMLFDENESWYKKELKVLAKEIGKSGVCVEVNTGAICRLGARGPYPSPYLLEQLKANNVPLTINSDAHTAGGIDCWFDEAVQYIKKAGYTELAFYEDGLKFQKI